MQSRFTLHTMAVSNDEFGISTSDKRDEGGLADLQSALFAPYSLYLSEGSRRPIHWTGFQGERRKEGKEDLFSI